MNLNLGTNLEIVNFSPLAVLLGIVLLTVFFLLRRPHGRQMPSWAHHSGLILRLTTLALLMASLYRPQLVRATDVVNVVFVLDASASISETTRNAALSFAHEAASQLEPSDRVGLVVFGAAPLVSLPLDKYEGQLSPEGASSLLEGVDLSLQQQTNLASALRLARGLFPTEGDRRLVLLSDGNENVDSVLGEANALLASGIRVMALTLPPLHGAPEALIESLETPSAVREGERFDSIINVRSTDDTDAVLRFFRDGQLVAEQSVKLYSGINRFALNQQAIGEGFRSFRATLSARADTLTQNNEATSYTIVKEKPRVLILEGSSGVSRSLAHVLASQSILVETRASSQLPTEISSLEPYHAVVLVDAPATGWTDAQMQMLRDYAYERGRGLVVVGGKNSYGPGGYTDTPLEAALPVSSIPPSERENISVSLLLIIDKSGSMSLRSGDTDRITMAKEAAIRAVEVLDENDEVGVLAFDIYTNWVVEPQPLKAPGALASVQSRIAELDASGGTDIFVALEEGYKVLRTRDADMRHIILLSDGVSYGRSDYDELLEDIRRDKITLSTLALGTGADTELLQRLAKEGKGRYYFTDNAADVPDMLVQDTRLANRPFLVEQQLNPQTVGASPVLRGLSQALPSIGGYVVTTPKPEAQVIVASPLADPLLAHWQYGLGRVVAWTSSTEQSWAGNWLGWPEFEQFWVQAVRWSLPSPVEGPLQVRATLEGQHVRLTAEALNEDRSFRDLVDTVATVVTPSSHSLSVLLRQMAPGIYEGRIAVGEPGAYMVQVRQLEDGPPALAPAVGGFVVPAFPELSRLTANHQLLEQLAADTGGRMLSEPGELSSRPEKMTGQERQELWPWLLGLALAFFMLDVIVRRLWMLLEELPWPGTRG